MSKPQQFNNWPESLEIGFGPYRATAERVIDGDSAYVFADLGLNSYAYLSVRLKDTDAPEIFSGPLYVRVWGQAAAAELRRILPRETKCLLHTTRDKQTFSRYEGVLVLEDRTTVNDRINGWMREQSWWTDYVAYKQGT